jgi:hypothetical protein
MTLDRIPSAALAARIRAAGERYPLHVVERIVRHHDGSDMTEAECRRVLGLVAADAAERFTDAR